MLWILDGYCYDLNHMLICNSGVTVISQTYLGDKFRHFVGQVPPNRAHQCNHTCLDGEALMRSIVMPLAGASY